MNGKKVVKSIDFANQKITFEVGLLAPRANAAVLASMGETVVLATVTISKDDTDRDYFPLSVEYIEKFYAGGVISGSRFIKRERFPSDRAVLIARMIDRSIRPLFPESFRKEVQVVVTVLSYDEINDPAILGINAASAAVGISEVPFYGPVAGVRVGLMDDKFVINPTNGDLEKSQIDFVLAGKDDNIVMIDAGGNEIPYEKVPELFDFVSKYFNPLIKFQEEFINEAGKKKIEIEEKKLDENFKKEILKKYEKEFEKAIYDSSNQGQDSNREEALEKINKSVLEEYSDKYSKSEITDVVNYILKEKVRSGILKNERRPSGRKLDQIREIMCKVGVLPRTHGSAFFARGLTQSLSIVTLGSTRLEQILESFEGEETKRYMHHYNGQDFSLGEAGKYNYYPGRREIGHGALAEKALVPVIPTEEEFPYTIRVVSEILSQQGSSSMAATCGSTLALMDAGVPIKRPVAGIAVGLVTSKDNKSFELLTDIQDLEDYFGDMDFKVTGTKFGITAIQMDNKLRGINKDILKEAVKAARDGIENVLKEMEKVINKPRENLSKHAPKIKSIKINPSKIGDLIGPQGKNIRNIIEETGVEIDIKDDGMVHICYFAEDKYEKALQMINQITEEAEVGKVYEGVVDNIQSYGAFINVSPSISGLVHISEISDKYVKDPAQFLKKGQKVKVKVIGIDSEGRINFSIKRVKDNFKK